jgi:hypothetical protein
MWRQAQQRLLSPRRRGAGWVRLPSWLRRGATLEQVELDLRKLQSRSILEQVGPDQGGPGADGGGVVKARE